MAAFVAVLALAAGCSPSETTTEPTFPPLMITTQSLPDALLDAVYAADVEAVGGDRNYTWSVIDGSLPEGLSLNTGSGTIEGRPTVAGGSSFMIQVTSGDGQLTTRQFTITVVP